MMTIEEFAEHCPDAIVLDGYDKAIVGVVTGSSGYHALAYSVDKIIRIMMRNGMTREGAIDFFHYNIEAHYGKHSPIFLEELEKIK